MNSSRIKGFAGSARLSDGSEVTYRVERTSQIAKVPRRVVNVLLDRSGGLLIALLTLPLYVPVIIFGSQFVQSAIEGWSTLPSLSMLAGLLIGAIALAPLAIIGGLRLSIDA